MQNRAAAAAVKRVRCCTKEQRAVNGLHRGEEANHRLAACSCCLPLWSTGYTLYCDTTSRSGAGSDFCVHSKALVLALRTYLTGAEGAAASSPSSLYCLPQKQQLVVLAHSNFLATVTAAYSQQHSGSSLYCCMVRWVQQQAPRARALPFSRASS